MQNAEIGKARTIVSCDRTDNLPIPSGHKLVRYLFANRPSLRDREQVFLAFRPGVGDQGPAIEPLGLTKYGTCDVNRIVKRKFPDDFDGRIVGPSQSLCELSAGRSFNILLQPTNYFSKHPDFVVGIPAHYQ